MCILYMFSLDLVKVVLVVITHKTRAPNVQLDCRFGCYLYTISCKFQSEYVTTWVWFLGEVSQKRTGKFCYLCVYLSYVLFLISID